MDKSVQKKPQELSNEVPSPDTMHFLGFILKPESTCARMCKYTAPFSLQTSKFGSISSHLHHQEMFSLTTGIPAFKCPEQKICWCMSYYDKIYWFKTFTLLSSILPMKWLTTNIGTYKNTAERFCEVTRKQHWSGQNSQHADYRKRTWQIVKGLITELTSQFYICA